MQGVFWIAKVAVNKAAYSFDKEYSYHIPSELVDKAVPGARVLVPFGKGNRTAIGFILRVFCQSEFDEKVKPLTDVIDDEPLVTEEMLKIIMWLKDSTFCTYYDAYRTVVPTGFSYSCSKSYTLANKAIDLDELSDNERDLLEQIQSCKSQKDINKLLDTGKNPELKPVVNSLIDKGILEDSNVLKRKVGDETVKVVRLSDEYTRGNITDSLTVKQSMVVKLLQDVGCATVKEICYMTGCTNALIKRLEDKGIVTIFKQQVMRNAIGEINRKTDINDIVLNHEQSKAYEGIMELVRQEKPAGALLYGVTGSGKTSVFYHLINDVLKMGKTALMLVPEISLTPQMLSNFKAIFGSKIAVIHSSLSLGQRTDEFRRIKNGDAKIVIGTRSAVFAPLSDIGIIIMDEEGESSYKSENSPRYHARDAAIQRCGYNKCVLVMASATPSLESFYFAQKHRYHLFRLDHRYSDAKLPAVKIVDMQQEALNGNTGIFSEELKQKIGENLQKNEQTILLLNRRGFSTFATCLECKKPISCPNCNVPLTYHKKNNKYMCHYCGYTMDNTGRCPECGSEHLHSIGMGTQRIEEELAEAFPSARLLRMDADTTFSRYSYEEKFSDFEHGKYDIMLGTQMIAKGLNFPDVTLVGVISLDKALFNGDFRSYERTFSLITQVAGRCGRGVKPGYAYIQTYVPEHYVINLAAQQNYDEFYNEEIALRHALIYPPFCDICTIVISSELESRAITAMDWFTDALKKYIKSNEVKFPLRVLGPAPCAIEVMNKRFRYRLLLKCKNNADFRRMIKELMLEFYSQKKFGLTRLTVDINGDVSL